MKKRSVLLVSIVIIVALMSSILVACGGSKTGGHTPVYQGMSISSSKVHRSSMALGGIDDIGDIGDIIEDIIDGDYEGRDDHIDVDDPFGDGTDEDIEEEIKSSLEVTGAVDDIYYAQRNEDIFITIHINNPDSYEIMSFTLNGKKYTSYMFEDGSDMENIILKYNVGANSGIVSYTIDAIKYIDGTEIKDVIIDGNKTVKAGIYEPNQVMTSITNEVISTNGIQFDVNIKDSYELLKASNATLYACLYDGTNIIDKKPLQLGDNSIEWTDLQTSTMYEYGIAGYYDDLSGNGLALNVLTKKAFYTKSVVLFNDIVIGQDNITWTYLWDNGVENKTITSLKLYKGTEENVLDTTATSIDGLLSNTEYRLVAEYANLGKTESISVTFRTHAKQVPTMDIINVSSDKASIAFDISEVDTDNVGNITKIELLHGTDSAVVAKNVDLRKFDNLLSDNDYTIKVTYEYDLNDGVGVQTITQESNVKTVAKAVPTITFKDIVSTKATINGEYIVTDTDSINTIDKVELYNGETLVKTSENKTIAFDTLEYYTAYTIKVSYHYDLNDGVGVQNKVATYDIKTQPHIGVTSVKVSNTSAVSEGETIYMQATLDNSIGATIDSVVVNGVEYGVVNTSTANRIFVEIVFSGQFAGGDTPLTIEKINVKLDGNPYVVDIDTAMTANVFINGKLEVLSISYVNEQYEPIDWCYASDKVYGLIKLNNPTKYIIDSLSITKNYNSTSSIVPIKIDDETYYFDVVIDGYNHITNMSLTEVSFRNEYITKKITYSSMTCSIYRSADDTTHYIRTAEDLKNVNDGYYYELANDIDLAGIEWRGVPFNGAIDGKDYSIKNMSYVGTVKNANLQLGLFINPNGTIKNINMVGITFIVDIVSDDGNKYESRVGGISNHSGTIINCTVDDTSVIKIDNKTGYSGCVGGISGACSTITNCTNNGAVTGNDYVGGISGDNYNNIINNCTNNGSITGNRLIGGIAGVGGIISNCVNNGRISANDAAGGISGANSNIKKSLNNSKVIGKYNIGGIIGFINDGSKLEDCINSCSCTTIDEWGFGGIGGSIEKDNTISNSYTIIKYNNYDVLCTTTQLNDKTFYTKTLGWAEDIWDFSNLDVENGKYPVLKNVGASVKVA